MDAASVRKIEELVSRRESDLARDAIRRLLRRRDFDEATVLRALEWYRRLGLYSIGYRLAVRLLQEEARFDSGGIGGKLALWIARYLYLQGATRLSIHLIERIQLQGLREARDHHFVGEAFLAIGDFERALKHYSQAVELETEPLSRSARICRLGLADSLAGSGRLDEALALVRKEKTLTEEPVALAVILSCEGEYLARQERFVEARAILEAAKELLPEADRTVDRALCLKWLGFAMAKSGEESAGLKLLEESRVHLARSGIRKEAVFDVLWLEGQIRPLPRELKTRVIHFPGLDASMARKFGAEPGFTLGTAGEENPRGVLIDFGSDEFRFQGKWNLGLPMEVRLLGLLVIAGEWGLPRMRAMDVLWPDQPLVLPQLEKRLEQMSRRLSAVYGLEVETREGTLFLDPGDLKNLSAMNGTNRQPRVFLQTSHPTPAEVMSFYSLKKSSAYAILKTWKEQGQGSDRDSFQNF